MAITVGEVEAILKLRDEMSAQLKVASRNMKQFGGDAEEVGKKLTLMAAPLALIGGVAVKMAADFEGAMLKVETLGGSTAEQVAELRDEILKLAGETAVAPKELAEGLFFVSSAGLRGKEGLSVLTASAKAAAVGLGSTAVVADAVTSAVNAYGKMGLQAADAVDVLIRTVQEGKMPVDALAGSLGKAMANAANSGVKFAELGAWIATMTRQGVDAAIATTSLNSVLKEFIKPSKQAEEALQKVGLSAKGIREEIREKGLLPALVGLTDAFKGNDEELAKVVGDARAWRGVMATVGTQAETYTKILESTSNATGSLDTAFNKTTKTFGFTMKQMKAQVEEAAISLGVAMIPTLKALAKEAMLLGDVLKQMAAIFEKMPGPVQSMVTALGLAVIAIGPLTFAVGKTITLFGSLLTIITDVAKSKAFTSIVTNIGMIGTASSSASLAVVALQGALGALAIAFAGYAVFRTIQEFIAYIDARQGWAADRAGEAYTTQQMMMRASALAGRQIETEAEAWKFLNDQIRQGRALQTNLTVAPQRATMGSHSRAPLPLTYSLPQGTDVGMTHYREAANIAPSRGITAAWTSHTEAIRASTRAMSAHGPAAQTTASTQKLASVALAEYNRVLDKLTPAQRRELDALLQMDGDSAKVVESFNKMNLGVKMTTETVNLYKDRQSAANKAAKDGATAFEKLQKVQVEFAQAQEALPEGMQDAILTLQRFGMTTEEITAITGIGASAQKRFAESLDLMKSAGLIATSALRDEQTKLTEQLQDLSRLGFAGAAAGLQALWPQFDDLRKRVIASNGDLAAYDAWLIKIAADAQVPLVPAVSVWDWAKSMEPLAKSAYEVEGINEDVVASAKRVDDAYQALGMSTPKVMAAAAEQARRAFAVISQSAGASQRDVQEAYDRMIKAERDAAGKVTIDWKAVAENMAGAMTKGLAAMITGLSGFKESAIQILRDLGSQVAAIFEQMLGSFVTTMVKRGLGAILGEQRAFSMGLAVMPAGGAGNVGTLAGGTKGLLGALGLGGGGMTAAEFGWSGMAGAGTGAAHGANVGVGGAANIHYGATGGAWGISGAAGIAGAAGAGAAGIGMGLLGKKLFGPGWKAGAFGAGTGAASGAAIGSVVPGIGTAAGAVIGGIAGALSGAFGESEQDKVKKFRKTFEEQLGGVDKMIQSVSESFGTLGLSGVEAQRALQNLWNAKTAKDYDAAVSTIVDRLNEAKTLTQTMEAFGLKWEDIGGTLGATQMAGQFNADLKSMVSAVDALAAHGGVTDAALRKMAPSLNSLMVEAMKVGGKLPATLQPYLLKMQELGLITETTKRALLGLSTMTAEDFDAMSAAAQKYGIDVTKLGTAYSQIRLDQLAADAVDALELFKKGGADMSGVLAGMSDEISQMVLDAIATGATLPKQLEPYIKSLEEMGLLVDKDGNAIADLTKLKFSDSLATSVDNVTAAIDRLIQKLDSLGQVNVTPKVNLAYRKAPYVEEQEAEVAAAAGIYATRPTRAWFGEGGQPELGGPVGFMSRVLADAIRVSQLAPVISSRGATVSAGSFTTPQTGVPTEVLGERVIQVEPAQMPPVVVNVESTPAVLEVDGRTLAECTIRWMPMSLRRFGATGSSR